MNPAIAVNAKNRFSVFGTKGETYDGILNDLMEVAALHGFLERQKWILGNGDFVPVDKL